MAKTVAVISDLHCGHYAGLTHPSYQIHPDREGLKKTAELQRECWTWYERTIRSIRPDVLLVCGDCIDGAGHKSGGTEEMTTDREEQVEMAARAILAARARKIVVVAGTAYHVGQDEDWEKVLADKVGAVAFSGQEFLDVDGVRINLKHHVGGSQREAGRFTALANENLSNMLWAEHDRQPRCGVILRGHVHYHRYCGGPGWVAMTLPALQAAATKFGRRCSGTIDYGLIELRCDRGDHTWQSHILRPAAERAQLLRL